MGLFCQRCVVNDLNGPLYILYKKTRAFTTYLNFDGNYGQPGTNSAHPAGPSAWRPPERVAMPMPQKVEPLHRPMPPCREGKNAANCSSKTDATG